MFFSNGHPSCQGSSYPFATTTANFPNTRFVYSYKKCATVLVDTDLYHQKLDRILDLLQDQHYSELNKIMGTMTINEVASYLSKSVRTIERRIAKGFLKAAYKEGNADLFLKKDVVELYIIEYKKWPRQMP
ncbi:helix-turn-helix domain-containing protein [Sphingobacterium athyrii]|uniref:helix-turn-helix domain-containing protein n=1 Tax=Sphingobacterium athyrii TaxID=2152717 RepID=UPI0028A5DFB3|nr:helix-turn-helix domain-containing protein [Sphingobacterium athyrii]